MFSTYKTLFFALGHILHKKTALDCIPKRFLCVAFQPLDLMRGF